MKTPAAILLLFLACLAAHGQALFFGLNYNPVPLPAISNPTCVTLGHNSPNTTAAIDTTGAKAIAVIVGWGGSGTVSVTDNKSNGSATALTQYTNSGAPNYSQIFYWLTPTVGTGHTFTVTGTSSPYAASACILPLTNITGVFDSGTDSGAAFSGSACTPASSITPGTGAQIIITGLTISGNAAITINHSFLIDATAAFSSGTAYGISAAHLVQGNGTAIQPTWSSGNAQVCSVAAFH